MEVQLRVSVGDGVYAEVHSSTSAPLTDKQLKRLTQYIGLAMEDPEEPVVVTSPAVTVQPKSENPGSRFVEDRIDPEQASLIVDLLSCEKIRDDELLVDVLARLLAYVQDRANALQTLKRAGYPVSEDPEIAMAIHPLVDKLLFNLSQGRQTIDFLSRPPKLRVDALPHGTVFTTADGRLLEVRRDPLPAEACVVCYEWNRDDRPAQVDRKQLVQPIGRVTFDDRRKQVKLGLLELKDQIRPESEVEQMTITDGERIRKLLP